MEILFTMSPIPTSTFSVYIHTVFFIILKAARGINGEIDISCRKRALSLLIIGREPHGFLELEEMVVDCMKNGPFDIFSIASDDV